jgi:hypothetical protein
VAPPVSKSVRSLPLLLHLLLTLTALSPGRIVYDFQSE